MCVYMLDYAVGPLFMSPLSTLSVRVTLYHAYVVIFTTCTTSCGRINDLPTLAI
ncbi:uncharacterized protein K460DRAFT_370072 [Cucurbitaria berberidis CBS 394.84]|uniref:Uncharacterized protein n=1 Tax=Cucurbitaria berberidis CBS 394.84 TaxID=1168544 RepID=A0A9P4L586_9PLEO|nr:uncharacterized protein K460DRAFT_370072 [Cucurbitaria berberidis CBS 394.84]KAF1842074.1 hypothetical protein K460DRAFT_370072 [Cucurbitaria berberidis CBS 394.84]